MDLVSVVIPTFNQARYLKTAIESVLKQTYPLVELIIVNDGSTDETNSIISQYADRAHIITQANRGLPASRNAGFAASHGRYIHFFDSDDEAFPEFIERLVDHLEKNNDLGLAFSAWEQMNPEGVRIKEVHYHNFDDPLRTILTRDFFFFPSMTIMKRDWLEKVGPYDESLTWSDDADIWLKLALNGCKFGYIDQALIRYRIHHNSMSNFVQPKQIDDWHLVLDRFFSKQPLPDSIIQIKPKAYSVLHFETAGRYFRAGNIEKGQDQMREAMSHDPEIDQEWFLNWLAGTAQDARTKEPIQFVNSIFDNLIPEMEKFRALRTKGMAQYFMASAFSAFQSAQYCKSVSCALNAIYHHPPNLRNKGLHSILWKSIFKVVAAYFKH